MKKRILMANFLFWILLFLCIHASGAENRLVIQGRVIDKESKAALMGAFLEIENASGGSGYSRAYTDEKGEFVFSDLPTGVSFNLYVEKQGFTSYRRLYWYIDESEEIESIVVKLSKEAVLKCRITASDKTTPIKQARVALKPMGWREDPYSVYEFERETGDNGLVTINKIPSGPYELIIVKTGYVTDRITNIAFVSGKKKEMDIALYQPASISGRVLLKDEEITLAGISIISRGPSAGTATSNLNGVYVLNDLKPGTYGFTAAKPGFHPYTFEGQVTVKEGEDISGVDHFLEAEEENIRIAIYQEVYPLKEEIKFTVRAFRSEDFKLEFYRVPIKWYLKNPHAFDGLLMRGTSLRKFKIVHSAHHGFKQYRPFTWFTKEIEVEHRFSPGIYLIRATTAEAEDRNFIFVSNLGVVVKRGKGSLLAYTVNFETNQPEKEVDLFLLERPLKKDKEEGKENLFQRILGLFTNKNILLKGKTDDQGIFEADQGVPSSDLLVIGLKSEQGVGISESFLSSMIKSEGAKYYFYTDRPVYRPGNKVFFKGILRVDDGTGLKIKRHHEVSVEVKDPDGHLIATLNRTSDELGTLNGSFELAPDAALGRYTLSAEGIPVRDHAHFFVQDYRKPDFKIELTTDKEAYVTNETVKCRILAAYFFGAPLADMEVEYNIYQKMSTKPYYRYWWEGEYYREEGYQSLIKSGKAKTDSQGFVSIEFTPSPKSYDRIITIEAEVIAPSGRKVMSRKSVVYNQSLYQIEVSRYPFIHKLDRPLTIRIDLKDINGRPVKAELTASLEQEIWNPVRNRYEKPMVPMYSMEFETDEHGTALLEIPSSELKPGHVRFVVSAIDPNGIGAVKSTSLWLYDSLYGAFDYNYAGLEMWVDKENYRPGDVARLLINTPVQNGAILYTMEGLEIMDHQVIPMMSRTRIIEIPVRKSYAPNIWLSALQHDGNRLYHKKVSLNVAVEGKEMTIEAAFDKKEYRPGDTAELKIRATDHEGKPVSGDFSVGVVDEAVYYIRPDHTVPIHSYFYAKRSPWISTSYSFPIKYLGGAVKDKGDSIVRKEFRDTAFWLSNLSTDSDGTARAEIPFPDNLTTWVTTIRGHSPENIFGEKREKSLVTKPLVTDLKLPRFFIQGDHTEVRAIDYNRTENPLEQVESRLEVEMPLSLVDHPVQTMQIPKQGTGQLTWRVKIGKGPRESTLTIYTASGRLHDAEQRTVPVLPKGLKKVYDFNGRTHDNLAHIDVPLPEGHVLALTSLDLEFVPHPALAGLTALDYLARFPYGCVEQTLNSFVPMASYYDALRGIGFALDDMDQLKKTIEKGLAKLENFQGTEGGFGWWKQTDPDVYMTSLVVLGVSKVRDIAPGRSGRILSRAVKYLQNQIVTTKGMDVMAFGLYALSEAGTKDRVLAKALKSNLETMDALALSLTIPALANHGMMDDAKKAANLLFERLEQTPDGSFFSEPASQFDRVAVETTAYALTALLRILPDRPEIEEIIKWLVIQKTGDHWVCTKTTGVVVAALSEYLKVRKDHIPLEDQRISVSLDDRRVAEFTMKRSEVLKRKGQTLSLPPEYLVQGINTVTLESEHDVYYAMRVNTFLEVEPISPESSQCDIPLSKKVFGVARVYDSRGHPRILSHPLEEGADLRVGEEIKIEVRFTPDKDYGYFILEDGLPSGFEVVDFEEGTGLSWWKPYARKERRDERVVFFFDRLPKDREVMVEYILRSELNGAFHLPPAILYGMYRPSVRSHSASGKLTVGPQSTDDSAPFLLMLSKYNFLSLR